MPAIARMRRRSRRMLNTAKVESTVSARPIMPACVRHHGGTCQPSRGIPEISQLPPGTKAGMRTAWKLMSSPLP